MRPAAGLHGKQNQVYHKDWKERPKGRWQAFQTNKWHDMEKKRSAGYGKFSELARS